LKQFNQGVANRCRVVQRWALLGVMSVCAVIAPAQTTSVEGLTALQTRIKQQDARIQELRSQLAIPENEAAASQAPTQATEDESVALEARVQQQDARIQELEKQLAKTGKKPREPVLLAQATPPAADAQQQPPPAQQPAPAAPAPSGPTYYPFTAVGGIYTDSNAKDLGKLTNIKLFEGIKFRGWLDAYYDYNFNNPHASVVNALQPVTAIKGSNANIQGRTFDIHSNSFTFDLAEIEIEKVPERGGVGFKFDMAFGDTQNIYNDTIIGALGSNSQSLFDKTFQHASISYLAPIGKGLRFDFGKFVTHIGGETIESIKNANFSHSFFYTYGIPFQDTGLRVHYDFNDKVYSEVYVLNGWNVGFDLNRGKTYGYTLSYSPSPHFSAVANWLGGPEQTDNSGNWRHLGDFQIYINPTPKFRTMTNVDVAHEKGALANGKDTSWAGVAEVLRYRVSERFDPSFRLEWYRDPNGFSTNVPQNLLGFTATLDTFLGNGANDKILIRPEFRYDHSNNNFFSVGGTPGLTRKYQATVAINVIYYF